MALSNLTATTQLIVNWIAKHANAAGSFFDEAKYADAISFINNFDFGAGTASSQINQIYVGRRTLALATLTDDLDLSGSLTNWAGETINFTNIKLALVYNECEAAGENLWIGGGGSNSWIAPFAASSTFKDTIYPNGIWHRTAPLDGFTVTAGSGDILRIKHVGVSRNITYVIILLGIG